MAIITSGPYLGVRGTFGGNTYYQDKWGRTILKRKNSKSNQPPTLGQLSVIGDTRIINTFMAPLKTFALIGFELEALHTMSNEYNAMVSYNRINAIQGIYPHRSIDYAKVLMTKGDLPVAEDLGVSVTTNGFTFSWNQATSYTLTHHTDQVMMMAYFSELKELRFIAGGAERSVGSDLLNLNGIARGYEAEVYIAFISADRQCISNSVYLDKLNW